MVGCVYMRGWPLDLCTEFIELGEQCASSSCAPGESERARARNAPYARRYNQHARTHTHLARRAILVYARTQGIPCARRRQPIGGSDTDDQNYSFFLNFFYFWKFRIFFFCFLENLSNLRFVVPSRFIITCDRSRDRIYPTTTTCFVIFIVSKYICTMAQRRPYGTRGSASARKRVARGAAAGGRFIGRPLHHLWPSVKSMRSWTFRHRPSIYLRWVTRAHRFPLFQSSCILLLQ